MAVTGGLVGIDTRLELDHTGDYQAFDNRQQITRQGRFSADSMADVVERLPLVCAASDVARPPACADCYAYELHAALGSESYEITLNDVSLAQAPAGELVGMLSELLQTALED